MKDDDPFSMQSLLDSVSFHLLSQGTSASHWHPLKRVKHNEVGGSANIRGSIARGVIKEEEFVGEEGGLVDFETLLAPVLEEMKSARKRWREERAESAMQVRSIVDCAVWRYLNALQPINHLRNHTMNTGLSPSSPEHDGTQSHCSVAPNRRRDARTKLARATVNETHRAKQGAL